jgi:hypothetical protein
MSCRLKSLFLFLVLNAASFLFTPLALAQEASPSAAEPGTGFYLDNSIYQNFTTHLEGEAYYQAQPEPTDPNYSQGRELTERAGTFRKLAPKTYQDELKREFIQNNPDYLLEPAHVPLITLFGHMAPLPQDFASWEDYQLAYQTWAQSDNQKWFKLWPYVPMFSRDTSLLDALLLRPSQADQKLATLFSPAESETPESEQKLSLWDRILNLLELLGLLVKSPQANFNFIQPQANQNTLSGSFLQAFLQMFSFLDCQRQRLLVQISPKDTFSLSPECQTELAGANICLPECNPNPTQVDMTGVKEEFIYRAEIWHGKQYMDISRPRIYNGEYEQVVNASLAAGVDPIFTLAIWLHESAGSDYYGICQIQGGGDPENRLCQRIQDFGYNDPNHLLDTVINNQGKVLEDHFLDQLNYFLTRPQQYLNQCAEEMQATECKMEVFSAAFSRGPCRPTAKSHEFIEGIKTVYSWLAPENQAFPCYPIKISE